MDRHIKNGMLSMGVWILFLVVLFGSFMTFTDSPFSDLLDEETGGFISGAFFLQFPLLQIQSRPGHVHAVRFHRRKRPQYLSPDFHLP